VAHRHCQAAQGKSTQRMKAREKSLAFIFPAVRLGSADATGTHGYPEKRYKLKLKCDGIDPLLATDPNSLGSSWPALRENL
jgi:hypothetical protein